MKKVCEKNILGDLRNKKFFKQKKTPLLDYQNTLGFYCTLFLVLSEYT